jgi:hypothetical protein
MSTTLLAIRQRVLKEYRRGKRPIVGTTTNEVPDTSSVIDSAAALPGATANHFDGKWIKIATTTDSPTPLAPIGEVRSVTAGGYAVSTGDFTTAAFSANVNTGDTYELHDFHPDDLDDIINELQRNLYLPSFFPLSMHIVQYDCNDMEASTIATDYELTTGGAAAALESTIVFNGGQSLKLTCSAANEYAALKAVIGVHENTSLYAAIMCYVTLGDDAIFRVIDVTGSGATIDDATTDEPAWTELIIPFTVPSGCEQIDLRLIGVGSDDVTYWDDVQIWHNGNAIYPLPSWITREEQVEAIVAFPQGTVGPASDNDFRTNEKASVKLNWHFERTDMRADQPLHVWVENPGGKRPYIIAKRALAAMTTDAGTTMFPPDLLVQGVLAEVYPALARMSSDDEKIDYLRAGAAAKKEWRAGKLAMGLLDPPERSKSNRVWVR